MNKVYYNIDYSFIDKNLIKNTYAPRYHIDSKNSWTLSKNKEPNIPCNDSYDEKLSLLKEVFDISNPRFDIKFKEAVFGKGNELNEITVMHSSSLCALLCFYKVSEDNPLTISINGEIIIFDDVYFEVDNSIFGPTERPSSVDVVLISKSQKVILFLESKFSEFINNSNNGFSGKYRNEFIQTLHLDNIYSLDNENLKLIPPEKENHYVDGMKQLLCHYMGLKNFINKQPSSNSIVDEYRNKNYKVYLSEIWFEDNNPTGYNQYTKYYKKVIENIKRYDQTAIILSDSILKYKDVFNVAFVFGRHVRYTLVTTL